jgi:hypothetical protein
LQLWLIGKGWTGVVEHSDTKDVEALLLELDELLLGQARDGKVTAAVALYRHVQARLKNVQSARMSEGGVDIRPMREIVAELEMEIARLKEKIG